jgi:sirohydrochlorin cobaltochelatase
MFTDLPATLAADSIPAPARNAPMASAPLVYREDDSVAWDRMWDSFCALASAGGPPHRGAMLSVQVMPDSECEVYQAAQAEIIRAIFLVSGLRALPAEPGWIAVKATSPAHARWLSENIVQENVQSRVFGDTFYVPVGDYFTLKGEVKNVVTAVAKTTHYWTEHLAREAKQAMAAEATAAAAMLKLRQIWRRLLGR